MEDSKNRHRKYYGQFVNEDVKAVVLHYFTKEVLEESLSKDEHFNDDLTPMKKWDKMTGFVWQVKNGEQIAVVQPRTSIDMLPIDYKLLKEAGEGYSNSTGVCIYKEAARQILETKGSDKK